MTQRRQWFLALGLCCTLFAGLAPAGSTDEDLKLVALAMHRETGRDIYLGGLRSEHSLRSVRSLQKIVGRRQMEFRIAARRTSIRSVLGGVLLQAEVARGMPPGRGVVDFADAILSKVQGSLYHGDSLVLLHSPDGLTEASLNGFPIARTDAVGVFDYFLSGWLGEHGPSTAFRAQLHSEVIDAELRAAHDTLHAAPARSTTIESWLATEKPVIQQELLASASTTPARDDAASAQAPVIAQVEPTPEPEPKPKPKPKSTSIAQTESQRTPAPDTEPAAAEDLTGAGDQTLAVAVQSQPEAERIGVIEYSQRLASFNTRIFQLVNSKIRYPRAAVRRGLEGRLELDVTLNKSGRLLDVIVARSSGYEMFDVSALNAARSAFKKSPAQPLDQVAVAEYSEQDDRLVIPVPVNFVLTE
jgi:protein TonB